MEALQEKNIYSLFRLSVFIKGVVSIVEIIAGFGALFISPSMVAHLVIALSQNHLAEDPDDFIALHALALAQHLSIAPQAFIAFYFLSRGLVKLALVIALLRGKLWAYPAAIAVLGAFMIYQAYQIAVSHSLFITLLTLFDFVVLWLVWHEYKIVRKHDAQKRAGDGVIS